MQLLSAERIGKQYDDRVLFEELAFGVEAGDRIGLIGVNGSGKSSLLKIIAGVEEPDSGQIVFRSGTRVAYLAQQPEMPPELSVRDYMYGGSGQRRHLLSEYEAAARSLHDDAADADAIDRLSTLGAELDAVGAWDADSQVDAILSRLGITNLDQPLAELSGGQRRRVALAHALVEPADLLILDEPTNHLDADTVDWLETMLARSPAALLLITHDRYVLDRLVRQTWELDEGSLYQYVGGYSRFLEQKLERAAQRVADQARQRSIMRRELIWLRQGPQGRGTKQKARIERIEAMQDAPAPESERQLTLTLGTQRLGTRVIELNHVSRSFDGRAVIDNLTLSIGRGERIGIVGPNGAGKSTLLNLIAGRDQPSGGTVVRGDTVQLAYYDQESTALDDHMRVIDYVKEAAELLRTSDGALVSAAEMLELFLFPSRLQYSLIAKLSGGERRRLYLLRTLMFAPNVLLLDEPSNDLDVQTLAALENYLDHFSGTLLIASHDRYLLDRTVDQLLVFDGTGKVRSFPGSYGAYAAARSAAPVQPQPKTAPRAPEAKPASTQRSRGLSFKERRELEALETRIAELEARQAALNVALSSGDGDYAALQTQAEELSTLGVELEQAFERWAELAAIAEGA